jgi:3-dehydroquinate synthase class II
VHAYTQGPAGRTSYLSELSSGKEVLVAGPDGQVRTAVVGRVKIEARPLVLVEAKTADGQLHSVLLQNAETVKLVGPGVATGQGGVAKGRSWRAVSVTEMQPGAQVLVLRQEGARHTGISIQESIVEK